MKSQRLRENNFYNYNEQYTNQLPSDNILTQLL